MARTFAPQLPTHHVRATAQPGSYVAGYYDADHRFKPTLTGVDLDGAILYATAVNAATITITTVRRDPS